MKVGEYVRTKNGEIGKLVNVEIYYVLGQNDKDKFSCVLFNNSYVPCIVSNDFIIKKGQLIDLIEIGDYVNGERVINIIKKHKYLEVSDEEIVIDEKDIKSIVTKEAFESMEYRIGEWLYESIRNWLYT